MSGKWNGKNFVVGAVVGSVVGAVTALLFAPKSGKELRGDISEQYGKVSEKTTEIAQTVGEKTKEIVETVGKETSELVGKAKEAAGSLVSEVRTWREGRKNNEGSAAQLDTPADEEELVHA